MEKAELIYAKRQLNETLNRLLMDFAVDTGHYVSNIAATCPRDAGGGFSGLTIAITTNPIGGDEESATPE
jgi:hypothetical protein